ncbi:MAG: glycosyltransferase, partial [Clostridiales Family XIII bacterium]|nr:glycosyltransferase [Clostridiales Family XIII bacterium]
FAICAYKNSPFLALSIESVLNQTVKSDVFISTSTPNDHIYGIAKTYGIDVVVNDQEAGIAGDWNYAYAATKTDFVTLAHQDDFYEPTFAEKTLDALARSSRPIIAFTDYFELRGEQRVFDSKLLKIKRIMQFPFKLSRNSRFLRNRVFSFGDPICCPSVTYNRKRFPAINFMARYKNSMDWEAWSRLAKEPGAFVYIPEPLLGHRIYEESQTTSVISSGARYDEDLEILRSYWPEPIARLIMRGYAKSMDSNRL